MANDLTRIWTLIVKNLLITLVRPWPTTVLRAFVLPVAFTVFMSVKIFYTGISDMPTV